MPGNRSEIEGWTGMKEAKIPGGRSQFVSVGLYRMKGLTPEPCTDETFSIYFRRGHFMLSSIP